ncbi:winged helix-turn-helix domain-containing protein [Alkalicoccobacillus murimartini]|uniref:ArsR family transcriptional regulator n=1 Tax=Alkalicoccobacillus murimartini TaxID=171685 RepID=A0ABT9YCW7_9BACI|nr:winged helix-turn-helix domain-containing protein [Alkalicoccobacillus murimartini]MDQ0205701.1 putative ArsR family transcriptional regulator [Alkalicoccobacillus murimartini]
MKFENRKSMSVTLQQQKLISTPLRSQIILLLAEKNMTAKQVADSLGKTAGSIHYHIQQLYKGDILEIAETKENKGIIEKYYRSKAIEFHLDQNKGNEDEASFRSAFISLTDDELEEFHEDINQLIYKYVKSTSTEREHSHPYEVRFSFLKSKDAEK